MNDITYELWKHIHQEHKKNTEQFSIVKLMTKYFDDIQEYGMSETSNFSIGWMCPIYKKNDRNEIKNYCPITIVNTDYKILTKVLALRLAKVAPSLLHKSQAGFVPGWSIAEQTKLIEMMIDDAEVSEQNGVIVALDQEKVYDKIAHDYLWKVLATLGFPEEFMTLVKALYQNAEITIMVNGHLSPTFQYFTLPPHSRWIPGGMLLFHIFCYGFHIFYYGIHTFSHGFHIFYYGFHTFSHGFHIIPHGFHIIPHGLHNFSHGFHIIPLWNPQPTTCNPYHSIWIPQLSTWIPHLCIWNPHHSTWIPQLFTWIPHYSTMESKTFHMDSISFHMDSTTFHMDSTSFHYGIHIIPYGFHNFPHGFHIIPHGFHNFSHGFHIIPHGFHNFLHGFHNFSHGFHNFPYRIHNFSYGFHINSLQILIIPHGIHNFYIDFMLYTNNIFQKSTH